MILTEREKMAIITTINIAFDICEETAKGECNTCPFWNYCQHADQTPGYYLEGLFEKVLDN